jgi:hypothetical protein
MNECKIERVVHAASSDRWLPLQCLCMAASLVASMTWFGYKASQDPSRWPLTVFLFQIAVPLLIASGVHAVAWQLYLRN